ncbi:serine/threonine-protein kinase [Anabaena sp. UHCC 0451]|uniref:serine/threonine-protein kinase n=1 Tax=Anabaena sp. UHCC 0451 TaxID=2055235 RepID=UPI002B1F93B5|nr:serine/threonine-protein kinase [Anabaena sp. UHCC 0451]MEA5578432.1 serine/threonine-protein kinase [Anabaena sp. UHCC 0451]
MLIQERYRLVKLIGDGGEYQTFLAVDENLFPPVSCIVHKFIQSQQKSTAFIDKVERLQKLNHHPQIPNLLAFFQEDKADYLVYEFIPGDSLNTILAKNGVFQEPQIWQILKSVLPVLDFIHRQQIIHCHLKPENLIIRESIFSETSDNLVKLALVNFASTQILKTANNSREQKIIGSPEYSAPEQLQGKPTFSSDLYSLGVTCIYLLTQIPPFNLFDVANNNWVWQDYLTQPVSEHLAYTLNKLINHDLQTRWKSTSEIITTLGIKNPHPRLSASISVSKNLTIKHNLDSQINTLAFTPNSQILASGDDSKNIKIWDVHTQRLITNISAHKQAVKSVAFSPNGQILASASDDKTIKLWNVHTWQEIITLKGHLHAVKSVAFNYEGNILASGSWDKTIKIWDVNTGAEICTLTGHQLQINAVAFSAKNDILASASCDRTVRLWKLQLDQKSPNCQYHLLATLLDHTRAVLAVACSANGQILATGSDDNTIKLWDIDTGELISTLLGHSWSVVGLAFTADSQTLISCSWDKTVKLWNVSKKSEIATLSGHFDSVSTVVISPNSQIIATGSRDKTIKLWNNWELGSN